MLKILLGLIGLGSRRRRDALGGVRQPRRNPARCVEADRAAGEALGQFRRVFARSNEASCGPRLDRRDGADDPGRGKFDFGRYSGGEADSVTGPDAAATRSP